MEIKGLDDWIAGYQKAWASNDPEDIGRLFSNESLYYTAPHQEPWRGREQIVKGWISRKDEPGTYEFRYEILGVYNRVGVVRGWTRYFDHDPPKEYHNIWAIKFNLQGVCEEFTEWWMLA